VSKLWDDLKDNMKDWSLTAVEKAEEMSKIAVAKTEEMTLISKLKFEIHQLHREMNQVYENLGRLAYKHTKNEHMASFSGNKEFFDLVNKIEEVKVKVKTKEKHIIDIKDRFESIDIEDRKSTGVDVKKSLNEEPSKIHDSKLKDI
tara:strand:- start:1340 stop:1777 length:438 start_codon:yes stop_codon:yes gene_type:complete